MNSSQPPSSRETPYSVSAQTVQDQLSIDVSSKEYEVFRQIFELCKNATSNLSCNLKNNGDHEDIEKTITSKDFKKTLTSLGYSVTEAEIGSIFKNYGSGKWSLLDTVLMLSNDDLQSTDAKTDRQELWETFQFFDRDGDGFISITDLQEAVDLLGLKVKSNDVHKMVFQADTNGDCRIDFKDFEQLFRDYEDGRKVK